jgi:glutaredoxin 3
MKKVIVYTRDYCPYCDRAKALLNQRGIPFVEDKSVWTDDSKREALVKRTGMKTVPQIFADDVLIGGYTELAALDSQDKLESIKK